MALTLFNNGLVAPPIPRATTALAETSTTALTATGMKAAYLGRMWNKDRANKTLVGVGLCFGAITKAGGSGLTISQQGIDHTNGPPYQPDGVQAQTWAVANANASFASNTWINTGDNAGVAINFGDEIAIVVEYDGSGRQGADSVTIRGMTSTESGPGGAFGTVFFNNTIWAIASIVPNFVLKFSDGTYGTIKGALPHSAIGSVNISTSTAAKRTALEFTVPYACEVDGGWAAMTLVTAADLNQTLYSGTTSLVSDSIDGNAIVASGSIRFTEFVFAPQSLASGTTYRWATVPGTTTNITSWFIDLNLAAHRQALPGWFGESGAYNTYDGSNWGTPTTTRVPLMGLSFSHFDNGAGAGGGLLKVGGMMGGMQRE